nr:SKP1-like protein 21 isoform X1 [Tanacetum cinerariifolium]
MFIDTHKDENSTLCLDIGICHSSKIVYWDSSNPLPKSPVNYEVESFILAVQWPPGVCSGVFRSNFTCRIDPVPTNFTIHGLWPQLQIENLDPNQIDGLTEELNKKWPDLQRVQDRESVNVELNLNWPDLKRPLPDEKQHSTPANTNADSNFMNTDDNYVASANVSIVQEQSSFVPENNVEIEEDRVDDRSVYDLLLFINSGNEDSKGVKPTKYKKKTAREK